MENLLIVRYASSVNKARWLDLLNSSNFANPFQTESFYTICKNSKETQGLVYAIENQEKKYDALCVVCIRKEKGISGFFSKRAIIYGGPVLSENCSKEALLLLIRTLEKDLAKKVIYIEIRNYASYVNFHAVYDRLKWEYVPYLNIKVKLGYKSLEELLMSFKDNRRRQIKQTLKAGITYKEAETYKEISLIYNILEHLYRNEIGLPVPSLQHFFDLWKSGLLKVFSVIDDNRTIGGSFCMILRKKAIYTYYYCGLRNYKPKIYPTHLALLAAMDYGINNQLLFLDFMGAGRPDTDYGVRKYKERFGGDLVEEGRYLKVTNRFLYWLGVSAINIMIKRINIRQHGLRKKKRKL